MQITALHNQSLLDVALQHTGTLEGIFDVALANGISVTDDLTPGQVLSIPENVEVDKDILNYYRAKQIQPATAIMTTPEQQAEILEGISIWAIGNDFKVS